MIGRDFLPIGKQDYSATVFETKEEAIDKIIEALPTKDTVKKENAYGNDWEFKDKTSSGVESRCRIWKVGE